MIFVHSQPKRTRSMSRFRDYTNSHSSSDNCKDNDVGVVCKYIVHESNIYTTTIWYKIRARDYHMYRLILATECEFGLNALEWTISNHKAKCKIIQVLYNITFTTYVIRIISLWSNWLIDLFKIRLGILPSIDMCLLYSIHYRKYTFRCINLIRMSI